MSKQAKSLVKALLQKDPESRPSATKILDHEWFECLTQSDETKNDYVRKESLSERDLKKISSVSTCPSLTSAPATPMRQIEI